MAVGDRIGRAEGRVGPRLCARRPCAVTTSSEVAIYEEREELVAGAEPRPLCKSCPERDNPRRPIRHVEVRLDRRNRHGDHAQQAMSATTLPSIGPDGAEGERGTHAAKDGPTSPEAEDDSLPAVWGPDHPARLALAGLEPQERPRRRGDDGASRIDPRDFGLCVPHIAARFRLKPNKNV